MRLGNYVFYWEKIPTVEKKGTIPASTIINKLAEFKDCTVHMSDTGYTIYSDKDVMKVVSICRTAEREYVPESFDCDDFSIGLQSHMRSLLPGIPAGIVWADVVDWKGKLLYKHALNVLITEKGRVRFLEPQTNKEFRGRLHPYLIII